MINTIIEEYRNSLSFDSMLLSSFGEASLDKSQNILCTKGISMKKHNFSRNYVKKKKSFKRAKMVKAKGRSRRRRWRLSQA